MKILLIIVAIAYLGFARADEFIDEYDDVEVNEEKLDRMSDLGNMKVDELSDVVNDNETRDFGEGLARKDANPFIRRIVRRVTTPVRRIVRRVTTPVRRIVRRVTTPVRRIVRRARRIVRRVIRRIGKIGNKILEGLTSSPCSQAKYFRFGPDVPAGKASASCIGETDYRKQARCWAPRIYYAIGEQYRASSVDFFLPHVKMMSAGDKLLQYNCHPTNLRAVTGGYLTTKGRLGRSSSPSLRFTHGQHNTLDHPIYTFYRQFKKNGVDYRDFFYWAFFPYNVGKRACIGGVIKKRCAGQCHWIASHVGDWEHVTVRLKNNLPYAMYISAHDFGGQYNYDNYRGTFIKGAKAWTSEQRPRFTGNIALRKPTRQKSGHGGISSRAVDGNSDSNWYHSSCTVSGWQVKPWWRVDLGQMRDVYKVTITNRFDCCWNDLRKFEIRVGNIDSPEGANMKCLYHPGKFGRATRTLYCNSPTRGRYLYIRKITPGYLYLCEVKVYAILSGFSPLLTGNIAYRKGTLQSSTSWNGHSRKAVDGNRWSLYSGGSCTHTSKHHVPWWRVDLGRKYEVAKVSITNRADCCWHRLRRVEIRVGNHGRSLDSSSKCTFFPGVFGRGETKLLTCSTPVIGRYVYVLTLIDEYLTLCEVQVYAYRPGNLARGKPTRQSSACCGGHSSRAVDGNRNGHWWHNSCTHTQQSYRPWWRVDLGSPQRIFKVALTNRADCCLNRLRNFEITIGNTDNAGANQRCVHYSGGTFSGRKMLTCDRPLIGRYVYVRIMSSGVLTLCEVEVYGVIGDPNDVKMTRNGHPVVFASKGSHGFWTRQGIHTYKTIANGEKLNDLASSGVNWDTWRNMKLIIFQKNPKQNPYSGSLTWLNYNGDWGNKKRGCVGGKRYIKMPHKTYVVKMKEICSLNGGPSSLNQRSEMQHYFPLA